MTFTDLGEFVASENFAILATGLATLFAAVGAAVMGARRGKPTETAIAAAAEQVVCSGPAISAEIGGIKRRLSDIEETVEDSRDILIRIEDRTRRG